MIRAIQRIARNGVARQCGGECRHVCVCVCRMQPPRSAEVERKRGKRGWSLKPSSCSLFIPVLASVKSSSRFSLPWVALLPPFRHASVRFRCPRPSHHRTSRGTEARTEAECTSASVPASVPHSVRRSDGLRHMKRTEAAQKGGDEVNKRNGKKILKLREQV